MDESDLSPEIVPVEIAPVEIAPAEIALVEIPVTSDPKLITMTIDFKLNTHINIDVAIRYIPLDNEIVGKAYGDYYEGNIKHKKTPSIPLDDIDNKRFKNQCTFVINIGEKLINTKVFNNGKLVNVGCKDVRHAYKTAEILANKFHNLTGLLRYPILTEIPPNKGIKKYFKDELRKRWGDLLQMLAYQMNYPMDMELLSESLTADIAYKKFYRDLEDNNIQDIMYLVTLIHILKRYFPEKEDNVLLIDFLDHPDFQYLLSQLIENTHEGYIEMVFPCYIHEEIPIILNQENIKVDLINHTVNCNYELDRLKLIECLTESEDIDEQIVYDPETYPGVLASHVPTGTTIIFFNTGRINITSAQTFQQVDQVYQFVKNFCFKNYQRMVRTILKPQITENDDMPTQFPICQTQGKQYYLLKKSHIMANPRNIYLLKKFGLLEHYDH